MKKKIVSFLIFLLAAALCFKNAFGLSMSREDRANLEKKINEYTEKIKQDPEDAQAHYFLGGVYYELAAYFAPDEKNIGKAISEFKKALSLNPDYPEVYGSLGMVYMLEGKEDQAVMAWNKGLEIKAGSRQNYESFFKRQLREISLFREEIVEMNKAVAANPKSAQAYLSLGEVYYKTWEKYRNKSKLDSAIEAFTKAAALNPKFAEARVRLGHAYLNRSEGQEKAIAEFKKAVEIKPNFPPFANIYMLLGDFYLDKGETEQAMKEYDFGFKMQSLLGIVWEENFATQGFLRLGQREEERWKKAVEKKSADYKAHYELGKAYAMQGKIKEASAEFEKTLKIKPDYLDAYRALGEINLYKSPMYYQKALKISPDDAGICYKLGWFYFYRYMSEKNKKSGGELITAAKSFFKKAIEGDPYYAEAHFYLGKVYEETGELDLAIKELKKAVEIEPYYAAAHRSLGMLYERTGNSALAQQHTREAKELGARDFPDEIEKKYFSEENK